MNAELPNDFSTIDTGDLPKDWRDANISNIFKKGDKHFPENYRLVSLTSVPCKLLEHIICRHLMKQIRYLPTSIMDSDQTTPATNNNKRLSERTHKGHQVDVAILDFSKAFDTVPP